MKGEKNLGSVIGFAWTRRLRKGRAGGCVCVSCNQFGMETKQNKAQTPVYYRHGQRLDASFAKGNRGGGGETGPGGVRVLVDVLRT